MTNHITRRNGSLNYYVRLTVPKELQLSVKNKKELWKSLKTTDLKIAKRLARLELERWEREFDVYRQRRTLTEHDLQDSIWNRYCEILETDDRFRQSTPTESELELIWSILVDEYGDESIQAFRIYEGIRDLRQENKQDRLDRLATLKAHSGAGEASSAVDVISGIIKSRQLLIDEQSPDYRRFAQQLQRAEIEAIKRTIERDNGEFGGSPTDPIVRPPTSAPAGVAALGESVMELFDIYSGENPRNVSATTLAQSRVVLDHFSNFLGRSFPVAKITKKEVREWKTALKNFPVKATEISVFKNLDFRQIIKSNETENRPCISIKTINRYLAALGSHTRWLVTMGYLEDNPTNGMLSKIDRETQKVFPYELDQLRAIFQSPLFIGCKSPTCPDVSGNIRIRDHRFWLPLLSLFSGARLGELAQLLVADIEKIKNCWVFKITTEGDPKKRLKTKGSQRFIPIHNELISLGFIEYHSTIRNAGHKWLFPEIVADTRNNRAGTFSRFYGRYLKKIGVKTDSRYNFHSFRHGFVDALRLAGYQDDQFKFLLGHTQNNVTGRYGILQEGDIPTRVKLIKKVGYKGLSLAHLASDK